MTTILMNLLIGVYAFAYVPEYSTIATHAALQHGRGAYEIEQDVVLHKDAETYSIKETWLVLNENEMRVYLNGYGPLKGLVSGSLIYKGGLKESTEDGQRVHTQRLGDDWLEPLFVFRSSKYFRNRMVALHVLPAESLKDRPQLSSKDPTPKYQAPSFIRLSRTGGVVNWAIGVSPLVGKGPTVWLEQDQFVLRKLRGADDVVLTAEDYAKYDDGFWFPRQRTYAFGQYSVQVQTLKVKHLGRISTNDKRFQAKDLKDKRQILKLPEADGLREFYSRFR
jgi:hypothetical protein